MAQTISRIVFFLLLVSFHPLSVDSQWSADPKVNTPLCTASGDQILPQAVTDGHHGAIVAWLDYRNGNADIYAQRVNLAGIAQWTDNGIAVCARAGNQIDLKMISDESGGAIMVWRATGSGSDTIFCQKIDKAGALEWNAEGVVICASPGTKGSPDLASDAKGGAIITWSDNRSGNFDIYAQRIDASGLVQWMTDGITICNAPGVQTDPQLAGNGTGGAVITWADERKPSNSDIYAQSIDASGIVQWTPENGGTVCADISYRASPRIIADDVNGEWIISWIDSHSRPGVHAQRLSSNGTPMWTKNGVEVGTAADIQYRIVSDGAGGAIFAWGEYFFPNNQRLCGQRVDQWGMLKWPEQSKEIAVIGGFSYYRYEMISLGQGCAMITYFLNNETVWDGRAYTVRIDTSGIHTTAVKISSPKIESYSVTETPILSPVCDGFGGTIITWYEKGALNNYDIYAQNIDSSNRLGTTPTSVGESDAPNDRGGCVQKDAGLPRAFALEQNYPNPFNPSTVIRYALPVSAHVRLEVYNTVGVRMAILAEGDEKAGLKTVDFSASGLASGIYFCRLQAGAFTATRKMIVIH